MPMVIEPPQVRTGTGSVRPTTRRRRLHGDVRALVSVVPACGSFESRECFRQRETHLPPARVVESHTSVNNRRRRKEYAERPYCR
jgi:hypothetical protein